MSDLETAIQRITHWLREYGDTKQKAFVGDVTMLLIAAKDCERLTAERDEAREAAAKLWNKLFSVEKCLPPARLYREIVEVLEETKHGEKR